MRDLVLFAFVAALLLFGLKRPFLFTLAYLYVDTVSPQRISYSLLSSMSISMVVAALAIGGWLAADKKELRFGPRQGLILFLLLYVTWTTAYADIPIEAWTKWEWVWKAMLFAIFLPFTLRTKLRVEAALLFLCLSAAAIIIVGGIKTVAGGAGYGVLNLMVDNNSGLYESSTISTVAIALIPLILWFTRHGTIFTPDWRVKLFCGALIFSCLLIPIGTEARTGLVCIAVLGLLLLRDAKRRFLYIGAALALGAAAIPFLPSSFTNRMETIQGFKADESAGTRLAVWGWTWNYALDHPMGGGFEAYRQNRIQVSTVSEAGRRRQPDLDRPEPRRRGPRLSQRLFRDARRAGLPRPHHLPPHPRHRPGADGGDPKALPARRGRGRMDRAAGDGPAEFPAHLPGRRPLRRHRLPAVRLSDDRQPDRLRRLAEPARAGHAQGGLRLRAARSVPERRAIPSL